MTHVIDFTHYKRTMFAAKAEKVNPRVTMTLIFKIPPRERMFRQLSKENVIKLSARPDAPIVERSIF